MEYQNKHEKKSPFPPFNVSVNYYTDPTYSADAFYGFADESGTSDRTDNESEELSREKHGGEVLDEPVESWGWVNNV